METEHPNTPLEGYGYWDQDPRCPVEDWQLEVENGDTRKGYWSWVRSVLEEPVSRIPLLPPTVDAPVAYAHHPGPKRSREGRQLTKLHPRRRD